MIDHQLIAVRQSCAELWKEERLAKSEDLWLGLYVTMTFAQSDQIAPRPKNAISLFPYFLISLYAYFLISSSPSFLISLFPCSIIYYIGYTISIIYSTIQSIL